MMPLSEQIREAQKLIWVNKGRIIKVYASIFNSTRGRLMDIIYDVQNNKFPPDLPLAVVMKLENNTKLPKTNCFKGEQDLIIIEPITVHEENNYSASRT